MIDHGLEFNSKIFMSSIENKLYCLQVFKEELIFYKS